MLLLDLHFSLLLSLWGWLFSLRQGLTDIYLRCNSQSKSCHSPPSIAPGCVTEASLGVTCGTGHGHGIWIASGTDSLAAALWSSVSPAHCMQFGDLGVGEELQCCTGTRGPHHTEVQELWANAGSYTFASLLILPVIVTPRVTQRLASESL